MKRRKQFLGLIAIAIITIALIACGGDDKPTHTHEWEWIVTTPATTEADGVETETCKTCGETRGTRPITKLIKMEFTIQNGEYTIWIKDGRTGDIAESLESLGIIEKFKTLLGVVLTDTRFIAIASRGLMIELNDNADYDYYKAIDGNTVGANFNFVSTNDLNTTPNRNRFTSTLGNMESLQFEERKPTCAGNCEQTYGTIAHLGIDESCTCPASKPCGCTEQTATVTGTTIPISKEAGITVKQMNDAVTEINTAYGYLDDIEKAGLAKNVTEIHIVSGSSITLNGANLKVGYDSDYDSIAEYIMVNLAD
jgi:hypothetical protein